ncbi:MAG: peptidase M3, partial [Muribaculaceae bacterium]|nr:peptidase M3 [Muribaculaceae bacterium]
MTYAQNPFFEEFKTPHNTPPFSLIKNSHYMEAIDRGIRLAQAEIDAITAQSEAPTFENTIVALERTGADLNRVLNVMYPMLSANSDDELMELSLEASAKLSEHSTNIILNKKLWNRVKTVYDDRAQYNLSAEDSMLLQTTYDSFALAGATLEGDDREEFRKLSARLSELTTTFGQNVLKELNTYEIWLGADDLAGLPESSVEAAALAAKDKGRDGEYLFTLAQPTYVAFMKYSDRPDLRRHMWKLYNSRNTKGEYSNLNVLAEIADTRRRIANLLGSRTYAEHSLRRTMARDTEGVYGLLAKLREAYTPAQQEEFVRLCKFAADLEGRQIDTI